MPTEQQLSTANIPRSRWESLKDLLTVKNPELQEIVDNLEQNFIQEQNFIFEGGDFSKRIKAACWIGVRALDVPNHYFRASWERFKPEEPHVHGVPFTVRYDEAQPMVRFRLDYEEDEFEKWAFQPDIFILAEVGNEFGIAIDVIDAVVRNRLNNGLMTIVTMTNDIRDELKYKSTTRDILKEYREISLRNK